MISSILATYSLARGASSQPAVIVSGDTFSFSLTGYNGVGTKFQLTPWETVAFNTTQTFSGIGPNGQDLTISSLETYGSDGYTRDTIQISAASSGGTLLNGTNFQGNTINNIRFNIGNADSGSDTVDYIAPISATGSGSSGTYFYSNYSRSMSISPTATFSNNNQSLEAYLSSPGQVNSIAYYFVYPNSGATPVVPELSGTPLIGFSALGFLMSVRWLVRRRKA